MSERSKTMDLAFQLTQAISTYDRKEAERAARTKSGYHNRYALAQYLMRCDEVVADVEAGATPRQAVIAAFSGRLRDAVLKGIGESKTTPEEDSVSERGAWHYVPASER